MNATGAVIFLPREGSGVSPMLQELLFDPAARWLAQALSAAGVERFFVVCHSDDREKAQICFPEGTEFVTGVSEDAVEQLVSFLNGLEGKTVVITKPVLLDWQEARQLVADQNAGALDNKDTGMYRLDAAALAAALGEGTGLEEALKENADMLGGRSVWFQGGYAIRSGWSGRAEAEMTARQYGAVRLMRAGVRVMDPTNCYIGPRVQVGEGTVILPGTILRGETVIGKGCEIGPNTMIRDCTVGESVTVNASQLNESIVDDGTTVGPFAYIRPNCHVGPHVKVGDFVELKNSNIGEGTKISHLTYVGDSDVGSRVNFGCGTVTVNYDGAQKYRTTIGDNAFIGCNTNLVAPVRVGEGAYTAAGSTITDEVPADSLAIARARQSVKKQWAAKRRARRR
ncbi:DapH/DapD/GlmU-related protein [Intestinimonas massiliensis (ex Afouda et al. 2020)]|uniref:DapH/DapD/GlmU-related protein n=1 Tax=Intestinimonas massiliensis (ex Afouda et al. 2020) TaxID=1673721 RepID=UPI0010310998|nr:DapH/DapD/GlmU-related protein [Intestinimonas massiliensis (ex Afouda et al. 2020)]